VVISFDYTNVDMFEDRETGTWVVLMQHLTRHHLPRARDLLERVEKGDRLSDEGIAYLKEACNDSRETLGLLLRAPAYTKLMTRPVALYARIITLALQNEQAGSPEKAP
jgi:hypothetical protein